MLTGMYTHNQTFFEYIDAISFASAPFSAPRFGPPSSGLGHKGNLWGKKKKQKE